MEKIEAEENTVLVHRLNTLLSSFVENNISCLEEEHKEREREKSTRHEPEETRRTTTEDSHEEEAMSRLEKIGNEDEAVFNRIAHTMESLVEDLKKQIDAEEIRKVMSRDQLKIDLETVKAESVVLMERMEGANLALSEKIQEGKQLLEECEENRMQVGPLRAKQEGLVSLKQYFTVLRYVKQFSAPRDKLGRVEEEKDGACDLGEQALFPSSKVDIQGFLSSTLELVHLFIPEERVKKNGMPGASEISSSESKKGPSHREYEMARWREWTELSITPMLRELVLHRMSAAQDFLCRAIEKELGLLGWPITVNNHGILDDSILKLNTNDSSQFQDLQASFSTLADANDLLRVLRRTLFEHNIAEDIVSTNVWLEQSPIEVICRGIVKRFKYHFSGKRETNSIRKPDYFINYFFQVIESHLPYLPHESGSQSDRYLLVQRLAESFEEEEKRATLTLTSFLTFFSEKCLFWKFRGNLDRIIHAQDGETFSEYVEEAIQSDQRLVVYGAEVGLAESTLEQLSLSRLFYSEENYMKHWLLFDCLLLFQATSSLWHSDVVEGEPTRSPVFLFCTRVVDLLLKLWRKLQGIQTVNVSRDTIEAIRQCQLWFFTIVFLPLISYVESKIISRLQDLSRKMAPEASELEQLEQYIVVVSDSLRGLSLISDRLQEWSSESDDPVDTAQMMVSQANAWVRALLLDEQAEEVSRLLNQHRSFVSERFAAIMAASSKGLSSGEGDDSDNPMLEEQQQSAMSLLIESRKMGKALKKFVVLSSFLEPAIGQDEDVSLFGVLASSIGSIQKAKGEVMDKLSFSIVQAFKKSHSSNLATTDLVQLLSTKAQGTENHDERKVIFGMTSAKLLEGCLDQVERLTSSDQGGHVSQLVSGKPKSSDLNTAIRVKVIEKLGRYIVEDVIESTRKISRVGAALIINSCEELFGRLRFSLADYPRLGVSVSLLQFFCEHAH